LAELTAKVEEERRWMTNLDGLSKEEACAIKKALWENVPTEPLLTHDRKSIDVFFC
jgi:hypothetical protein